MTEETVPSLPQPYPCTECASGLLHLRFITYFTWLDEELVTVPNFPAWVCDVCGRCEYDEKAISWLTMLLSPNAGRPTQRKRIPPRPRPQARPRRPSPDQS
jgi:YgiT-type zinc finger domain-containing protein